MPEPKSTTKVFVEAVEDHLKGAPHARHPVQFRPFHALVGHATVVVCTLCAAVTDDEQAHRRWHDAHNQVHAAIEREARAYKPEPRYR